MDDTNSDALPRRKEAMLVALDPDTRRRLKAAAQAEDRPMQYLIRRAIDAELARLEAAGAGTPDPARQQAAAEVLRAALGLPGGPR